MYHVKMSDLTTTPCVSLDTMPCLETSMKEEEYTGPYAKYKMWILACSLVAVALAGATLLALGWSFATLLFAEAQSASSNDPAHVHCLALLGDHLGHVVYANTTQREKRIWLDLCHHYWLYDPDLIGHMSIEVKSWYDGTADRLLVMIKKVEEMTRSRD